MIPSINITRIERKQYITPEVLGTLASAFKAAIADPTQDNLREAFKVAHDTPLGEPYAGQRHPTSFLYPHTDELSGLYHSSGNGPLSETYCERTGMKLRKLRRFTEDGHRMGQHGLIQARRVLEFWLERVETLQRHHS